jgi:hypothetical protein
MKIKEETQSKVVIKDLNRSPASKLMSCGGRCLGLLGLISLGESVRKLGRVRQFRLHFFLYETKCETLIFSPVSNENE